jgi:hypothetical protein
MKLHITFLVFLTATAMSIGCGAPHKDKDSAAGVPSDSEAARPAQLPIATVGVLQLDLSGAVALGVAASPLKVAVTTNNTQSGQVKALHLGEDEDKEKEYRESNLVKVAADGSVTSALSSGHVDEKIFGKFSVSSMKVKEDKIYLLFDTPIRLPRENKGSVDYEGGRIKTLTCWDGSVNKVKEGFACPPVPNCMFAFARKGDGILKCIAYIAPVSWMSFDAKGNLYYSQEGAITKMSVEGEFTTLLPKADFPYVSPDGDIYYGGSLGMLTRLDTKGNVKPLGKDYRWASTFPDGKLYMGTKKSEIYQENGDAYVANNDASPAEYTADRCDYLGAPTVTGDKVFAIGSMNIEECPTTYTTYYPSFTVHELKKVAFNSITTYNDDYSRAVLAGPNAEGYNKLVAFDTASLAETDLLPNENIKATSVSLKGDQVFFTGTYEGGMGLVNAPIGGKVSGSVDIKTLKMAPISVDLNQISGL